MKRQHTGNPAALRVIEANEKVFGTSATRAVLDSVTLSTFVSKRVTSMPTKDTVPVSCQK